jgi:branched-chain amino acid transport system ATP-binding protein
MTMGSSDDVLLETRSLTCDFGGLRAVDSVDFQVRRGELMSLIGPNGAGKTTFFNLLSGHLRPTAGSIFFRSREISDLPNYERCRMGIGRSFQLTNVFPHLTALENIRVAAQARKTTFSMWGSWRKYQDLVDKAYGILEQVGLSDKADAVASTMAYGEQRYLEIGIALATDPTLLLLDEPTAGMSPEESRQTAEFIKELTQRVDVILVEHDMEVVMNISDLVTCMHEGSIIACEPPDIIRQNPEVRQCYLRE